MDERKKIVEAKLKDADEMKKKAEDAEKDYTEKKQKLENSKDEIIEKAKNEAKNEKEKSLNSAKIEIDKQKVKWQEDMVAQKKDFLESLKKEIVKKFVNLSNKAISELSSESLEVAIVDHFLQTMQKENINKESKNVIIESSWELNNETKQKISERLKVLINNDISIKFNFNTELYLGINFQINGTSIKWNIRDYLDNFENDISLLFKKFEA